MTHEALNQLLKQYNPMFKALSRNFARKYSFYANIEAQDLYQECVLAACEYLEQFKSEKEVEYIPRIVCVNAMSKAIANALPLTYWKDGHMKRIIPLAEEANMRFLMFAESEFHRCMSIDEFEGADTNLFVYDFVQNLNPKEKTIVGLRLDHWTHQEIADEFGVSKSAITQALHKVGRKYLNERKAILDG